MTTSDEQLIAQGSAAEKLLQSDLFNDTVNSLVNSSFQAFTNSKPEESEQRERAYHHYRALVDIVSTLQQRVAIKDEIVTKADDDNNQEEEE